VKLLIEGLNKHAEPEGYALVIARFKKFKKDVDRIVYIRCDREGKASLNSAGFERRLHSDTRLMKCTSSTNETRRMNDILKSYKTRIIIILLHSPQPDGGGTTRATAGGEAGAGSGSRSRSHTGKR